VTTPDRRQMIATVVAVLLVLALLAFIFTHLDAAIVN